MNKILVAVALFLLFTTVNAFDQQCSSVDLEYQADLYAQIDKSFGKAQIEITGPRFGRYSESYDSLSAEYFLDESFGSLEFVISYEYGKSYNVVFNTLDYSKAKLYRVIFNRTRFVADLVCD